MLKHLRFYPILFILFLLSFIGPIQKLNAQKLTPSDSLSQILIGKEQEMFDVISSGNTPAAEKLFGQEYITINADGTMQEKEETMKTFGKFKGSTAKLSDKKIRIYDNVAIINGRAKFYVKQILVAEIFYTESWAYRQSDWEFIGWQGTMTGLPSWYPVIVTLLLLIILYFIIRLVKRKIRRSGNQKSSGLA